MYTQERLSDRSSELPHLTHQVHADHHHPERNEPAIASSIERPVKRAVRFAEHTQEIPQQPFRRQKHTHEYAIERKNEPYTQDPSELIAEHAEELVARPTERKRPIEQPVERHMEWPEQPMEWSVDRHTERQRPIGRPIERPIERATERPIDRPIERPNERPIEQPIERPVERPVERSIVRPIGPVEQSKTCPVELSGPQNPADNIENMRVEEIVAKQSTELHPKRPTSRIPKHSFENLMNCVREGSAEPPKDRSDSRVSSESKNGPKLKELPSQGVQVPLDKTILNHSATSTVETTRSDPRLEIRQFWKDVTGSGSKSSLDPFDEPQARKLSPERQALPIKRTIYDQQIGEVSRQNRDDPHRSDMQTSGQYTQVAREQRPGANAKPKPRDKKFRESDIFVKERPQKMAKVASKPQ